MILLALVIGIFVELQALLGAVGEEAMAIVSGDLKPRAFGQSA